MNYAQFRKPSRYIGNELNIIRKEADLKVALCFPDTYEIGMSHIGLKILYEIINRIPNASAERFFSPWIDLESYLRANNLPVTSLENRRELGDFDIIGFTLQYELSYTNVLNMLDLGGIPLRSEDRADNFPLIIAGGPCTVNPLPLAPFIDAFVIGDGEEVIKEIIDLFYEVRSRKSEVGSKNDLLKALSALEGIYVPSVHDITKQKIKRRIVLDLDKATFPDAPILPFASIVHDRVAIEISRGCIKGCRFCQAGMIYRPLRERSPANVLALAQRSLANTGYDETSFTSLSTGDYSGLLQLIRSFNMMCAGSHTSVSLPSLRVGAINSEVLKEIKSVRKTGFTIAPEAGTKRLRDVINKDFTDEEYDETLTKLFSEGWNTIKLYFMIGLPTETMEDIDGLINMAVRALNKGRQITGRRVNINAGISAFIPKAHTPFQWAGQDAYADLRKKQDYIGRAFRKRRINYKGQHVENSVLEAVFARGGTDSARLLENAWKLGCRFDGWTEHFDFKKWESAAEKAGIHLYAYASRSFDPEEELPWDFIATGITKKFLQAEYQKAMQGDITIDCREHCYGCGLECKERTKDAGAELPAAGADSIGTGTYGRRDVKKHSPVRLRVLFSKTGMLKYLSHKELMTSLFRAMRRAAIPVSYSAGFHPHPKVSFGPALAAGIEGLHEYFDIELSAYLNASDFIMKLNNVLPEGLGVHHADAILPNERSLNDCISGYAYEVVIDKTAENHIHSFMKCPEWQVSRDKKSVNIRAMVKKAEIHGEVLHLFLKDREHAKVRLYEILKEMLHVTVEEVQAARIKRVGLYGYNKNKQVCLSSSKVKSEELIVKS